jgi:tetratricopeptide (TPR) repeat protein
MSRGAAPIQDDRLTMTPGRSDPLILQAICEQGLALHRSGRLEEAAQCYDKVLRRNPRHADALHLLGTLYAQTGRPELGVSLLKRAVKANPRFAAAHSHLGMALWKLDRHDEALASYDAAIALRPTDAEAHNSRGIVLGALTRHAEALASHDAAIALQAGDAEAHYNRGVQLHHLRRPQEALASQDRAIALKPDYAEAHNNRGTALNAIGRPLEALQSYDQAIALKPDYAQAYANCGVVLAELKRFDEAFVSYDKAIALDPDDADAHLSLASTLLLTGRFEAGWREYEWRKRSWDQAARQFDQTRPWLGQAEAAAKRLFVHHEQGFGDTIQFSRFVKPLEDMGFDIALSVQTPLKPLLQPLMPGVTVLGEDERPAGFDYQCSLMSLPHILGTTLDSIPPPLAYRHADGERRGRFEALLGAKEKPRIGIAWSGRAAHKDDHNRSIAFDRLSPLLSEAADWIALQNEVRPSDAAAFRACGRVRFLGEELNDFADTAALVELMDLVISVDTSLAHLAGAAGKPVWVMLPFSPDWRWLLNRSDSPWYPTARLFRQPQIGDWTSVISDVGGALRSMIG